MGEYKVYCYMSPSGKRYKGVYNPPANPELARKRKSEAAKKAWERRKADGICQRPSHIS